MERFPGSSWEKEKQRNWKRKLSWEEESEGQLEKKRRKMGNKLSGMDTEKIQAAQEQRALCTSLTDTQAAQLKQKNPTKVNFPCFFSFFHKVFMNSPNFPAKSLRYFFLNTVAFKLFHFCQTS